MMMRKFTFLALVAAFLCSCAGTKKNTTTLAWDDLDGEWTIVTVVGEPAVGEDTAFIGISTADSTLYGSNSCNRIMGTVTLTPDAPNAIRFENVATTMMMCANSPMEGDIMNAINRVVTFDALNDTTVILYDDNAVEVLTIQKRTK